MLDKLQQADSEEPELRSYSDSAVYNMKKSINAGKLTIFQLYYFVLHIIKFRFFLILIYIMFILIFVAVNACGRSIFI